MRYLGIMTENAKYHYKISNVITKCQILLVKGYFAQTRELNYSLPENYKSYFSFSKMNSECVL